MRTFLKIVMFIFIIFTLVIGGGLFYLTKGLEEGNKKEITNVNLSAINDGTYSGKYNYGRWSNQINVTVRDHKITNIDIIKDVIFPKDNVAKQLFDNVMGKQSTQVDAISGATITCKAYLKSIENALNK